MSAAFHGIGHIADIGDVVSASRIHQPPPETLLFRGSAGGSGQRVAVNGLLHATAKMLLRLT
jgi:hypothetical protein